MLFLNQAVIVLGAVFIAVPLSKRLGLDATLGYLAAGVVLGPWVLGSFQDPDQIFRIAELGIALLLFVVGLELQPARLWTLRHLVFGLGGAQVAATGLVLGAALLALDLPLLLAAVLGVMLSASSTPMVLQMLAARRELTQAHGRAAFSVMLFQDLLAIPLFALIPLLAAQTLPDGTWQSLSVRVALPLLVLAAFLLLGRFVLQQVLTIVAQARQQEAFTATALFTVAVSAWVMDQVGLSPALGAFLAGVLLADSAYRHELQANIEPFKGLLISLLFVAVGMSLNLGLIASQPLVILGLVAGLVAVKAAILFGLARAWRLPWRGALILGLVLSQGGEFAFALLILAYQSGLMAESLVDKATLVVGLSMATTPLLMRLADTALRRTRSDTPAYDAPPEAPGAILIAGFGRVGQIVARILRARGETFTALEPNLDQVALARRFGSKVYFGDPARLDLLRTAGIETARLFVLTLEDVEHSLKVAEIVRSHFPHVPIYCRARNRQHVHRLMDLGITEIERETFHSSLAMARKVLRGIGHTKPEAEDIVERFRRHDETQLYLSHASYKDEAALIKRVKRQEELLAGVLADDQRLEN